MALLCKAMIPYLPPFYLNRKFLFILFLSVIKIDSINKMKAKAEKDKSNMERDLQEARGGLDEIMRERANVEKTAGPVKNWPKGQYLTPQEIIKQGLVPDWMVKQLEDKHGLSIARMTRDEAMQKKKEEQRLAELRGSMPCTVEIRRMTPAEVEQMNQRKAQGKLSIHLIL